MSDITAAVRQLAAQGLGRRRIAEQLGVTAHRVRVVMEAIATEAAPRVIADEPREELPVDGPTTDLVLDGFGQLADVTLPAIHATREGWLMAAIEEMRPWFDAIEFPLPETVLVSIGFPSKSALSAKSKRIGECWLASGQDGVPHVFITPLLDDPTRILDVLVHELVHAAGAAGHGAEFARPAKALGLTGKMTATVAGPELTERLNGLARKLGAFPHRAVKAGNGGRKVQTTRMLKVECGECGCVIRMTRMWLDKCGAPTCACGGEMIEAA